MKKITAKKSNGFYLVVFFIFFFSAILISLIVRGVKLYQDAQFNSYGFTFLVKAQDPYVIRVDNEQKLFSVLHIKDGNITGNTMLQASTQIGVPLHAMITLKDGTTIEKVETDLLSFGSVLATILGKVKQYQYMNEYDLYKVHSIARGIDRDNKLFKEINSYTHDARIKSQIEDELYELFKDRTVINERVSIEVINATDVSGLATQVAQMLETGGYNVVSVRSGDAQPSAVYITSEESETVKNLKKIFPFPVRAKKDVPIAEVTIVIGPDALN